ncbi:MAG TPA: hypothetical protein VNJ54_16905 [Plantibacter sp.]|uniref:hypothetical protein n=1 Tax=unclassified Plantibacter TaxID=2624265 RepID=UPI002BAFABD9|nr:hypothetical protein [Plantibacter sp.]
MDSMDDRPQIGRADIDRESLSEPGTTLTALIEALGFELDLASSEGAPDNGWRVLRRQVDDTFILGAPVSEDQKTWRVALRRSEERSSLVSVHPEPAKLRPSAAERRKGLELRWPGFTDDIAGVGDLDDLVVDIVNTSDTMWMPNEDSFDALGVLTEPGVSDFGVSWMSSRRPPAVPLGPDEYARIPVHLDGHAVSTHTTPGWYDLHVVIVELGLRTAEPLRVELTAELIARHAARLQRTRPDAAAQRRWLDRRIAGLQAQLTASDSLVDIARAVVEAASDQDAIARIANILGCTTDDAQAIYHAPMQMLSPKSAGRLTRQIRALTSERDDPDGPEGTPRPSTASSD